ncbi:protein sorting system archaetidylserine decarboxylase [Halostagnicola sp. A-GB9-2]|uniref:protein sorting system archaetidylserine decarboxylase n=1 Tax=Halostagnicola sp. A-GB9-2 TaxID=3048066 RepID=UPI0024C00A54|nr:protein sorting system archaetidylserine decarboxylase [Halostagnicola sp. A-GB9-2]MDJ1434655.1 protein sorting system archaetidylserine decarboxylase [Halostagnicola sp. A-GB9-2]
MKFAPGAWKYAIVPLIVAPFAFLVSVGASAISLVLGLATLAFFRDPDRAAPVSGTVAPADGNVSVLRSEGDRTRLGTFMNVWHVHVVRSPFDATVTDVEHIDGANKPAFSKDSDRNERVHVTLELEDPDAVVPGWESASEADPNEGPDEVRENTPETTPDTTATTTTAPTATVTFVAGAFARRIHPYIEPGETLERGQRLGHIAFGSRVDVLFPPGVTMGDITVDPGDSMRAGETVVLESPNVTVDDGFAEPTGSD